MRNESKKRIRGRTNFVSLEEVKARAFKKPRVQAAYDALEPEFQLIKAVLRARTQRGLTQVALAQRVGTTQSAIARFESGASNPTLDFMQRISRALGKRLIVEVR